MEIISQLIINKAQHYLGQREKVGNTGFIDESLDKKMRSIGFDDKEAWCSLFAELVWKEAYSEYMPLMVQKLDVIFSEGAVKTYLNFNKSTDFHLLVTKTPIPGALVFWQKYVNGIMDWRGHVGIFTQFEGGKMITIEGNTNDNGSRDGDGVYKKNRTLDYFNNNGLRLLGFVNPKI